MIFCLFISIERVFFPIGTNGRVDSKNIESKTSCFGVKKGFIFHVNVT